MYKFFLVLMTLLLFGCYQVSELPATNSKVGNLLLACSKESIKGPFKKFDSLELNLIKFFNEFVKSPDNTPLPVAINYNGNTLYDTRVDYKLLLKNKETPRIKALRASILGHIKDLELNKLTKELQIAQLINAYNFIAIDIVIQNSCEGLINSIADLGGKDSFLAFSDSKNFGYLVANEKLSLDQIEKEKIAELTNYEDARIHFAVICASGGCPVLLHKPFTGVDLNKQLNFITRAGLKLPRMFNNDLGTSYLSQIFDWYIDDFIADIERTHDFTEDNLYIQEFVKRYTPKDTVFNKDQIGYVNYDWTLNKL